MRILKLTLSGNKTQRIERVSNAFVLSGKDSRSQDIDLSVNGSSAPVDANNQLPAGPNVEIGALQNSRNENDVDDQIHITHDKGKGGNPVCAGGEWAPSPPSVGESISTDFRRLRMLLSDSIRQPARGGNFAGEMDWGYINLYDDDLGDDSHDGGGGDIQDERASLKEYHPHSNPAEICTKGYCYPDEVPEINPSVVYIILRECAKRWEVVDVDTSDLDATRAVAFNYITNWALRKSQDDDAKGLELRITLLGTDGSGETRITTAAVQKCREIFGNRTSVVVSARVGVDAENVGCGWRTFASLLRTVGDALPEAIKGEFGIELNLELQECRLHVIGEISMVGSPKLAAISERLRQCATEENPSVE